MLETEIPETTGPSSRTLKRVGIGAAVVAIALVAYGVTTRIHATDELESVAQSAAIPKVAVVLPSQSASGGDGLVLPGNVQAYNSAAIYARTNGYVRKWLADIGDHVNAGQTLAVLDAPDLDQQLAQAKADYQTALANQKLAASTSRRWQAMLAQDAVSQQEADEKAGDLAAKTALTNAALASVRELQARHDFTRLAAPFSGTVTSRSAQIGALVVAGTATAQPLFTVSDVHHMRIYVRVPQVYSSQVHTGMKATLDVPEYPGRDFDATMVRSANAVDAQSGSVLVELQADNPDGALKPGAYAHVRFDVGNGGLSGLRLPGSAILYGANGPAVAIVGANGTVKLTPVTIARDEGKTVLLSTGVRAGDKVIDSPPDSIASGDKVDVVAKAAGDAKNAKGGKPNG
ncbi:efflux RND transporter periplasmic adaptor subunit [Novosphingobium sp. 1949]|uniref:Efflux RND transporter periplasmic adaptor subunit n=1 Tax=Novosphingobium organovorum TaxID=2930092 RepID=A0ABT0BF22_9SPHN|nr:efflux RND transporter periplasmic adaptor subunit [Novosphingobium organovorum]MCJ2183453.1 efflux RND transporter periplasmic adaptor subunit [Novosphingobium organovorum]